MAHLVAALESTLMRVTFYNTVKALIAIKEEAVAS